MAKVDVVPVLPPLRTDYELVGVKPAELAKRVKPKQFISLDQSECIMCEGCVDICPWRCIHMLRTDIVTSAEDAEMPGTDPRDHVVFVIDEDACTRCALCVARCPTGVLILGKMGVEPDRAVAQGRDTNLGYVYGLRM